MAIWLRSWPEWGDLRKERNMRRPYVSDSMEKCVIHDYDYTPLYWYDDDILLLEWDIAADKTDRHLFAERAAETPGHVLVAPYRLHFPDKDVWAHRVCTNGRTYAEQWIHTYQSNCDLFGFGMIYLPRQLIQRFREAPAPERGRPINVEPGTYGDIRFHDQTFSMWHLRNGLGPVAVMWTVRPVHLHE